MFNFNKALKESMDPLSKNYTHYDKEKIIKISPADTKCHKCKVYFDDGKIYANANFLPGDIIEICPCKVVEFSYLDQTLKDIVFEIDKNKYAIPFGYVQYYLLADEEHQANCEYRWDPNTELIIIMAIDKIPAKSALYLLDYEPDNAASNTEQFVNSTTPSWMSSVI